MKEDRFLFPILVTFFLIAVIDTVQKNFIKGNSMIVEQEIPEDQDNQEIVI